jgi:site-specific recombinase XerD
MSVDTLKPADCQLSVTATAVVPAMFQDAGARAKQRFVEFFTANIRNPNTRAAYARAVARFCSWCEGRNVSLGRVEPTLVAAFIEELQHSRSVPTVKQELAAIRMLFDWMVTGGVLPMNPASSVRGPKHVVTKGKTLVLSAEDARKLLDSIDVTTIVGLRDRALIGVMVYSFARVSAVIGMDVRDYFQNGRRCWFRLHEKGGKYHEVPAHHNAEQYVDEYLAAAGFGDDRRHPLFPTADRHRQLTGSRMDRNDALRMVKRRARRAGVNPEICCHTFRATGITAYLRNGGTLEKAQQIAAHSSARTTNLYNRTEDELTLDEIERVMI